MSDEERYRGWLERRRGPEIGAGFVDRVMEQIRLAERPVHRRSRLGRRLLDWFAAHSFAQAAAILIAVVAAFAQGLVLLRIGIG